MPSGYDPMGVQRFSLATNAERVCAEIMLEQNLRRMQSRGVPSALTSEEVGTVCCCVDRRGRGERVAWPLPSRAVNARCARAS
jgi:hypothetical protein